MKYHVRVAALAAALSLYGVATAGAQQEEHKPGGLNKVAHDVSNTSKKAGRDTKAEVKRAGSKAHNELTDAGNETKTVLKKTTGIKGSQSHQPGGLNKVARNISNTSKRAGSDVKAEKNRVKSKAHGAATEAGKSVKDTVLKGKQP
jgi:nitrogenase molybdenum-iron protein alpha/beta subunit